MTQDQAAWQRAYAGSVMGLFNPARVLVRGEGAYVWDADGARYLDLLAGIAVNALGHAHPRWVEAVASQAGRLAHVSNLFATPEQVQLSERLLALTGADGDGRVFLANSGTEANEAAVKAALRQGSPRILALEGSFHGRTLGALALTHNEAYRKPFQALGGTVEFLPPGDIDALAQALQAADVAALVIEIIQGEAGVRPLGPAYVQAARELTEQSGTLLIVDEVQTGVGRCGTWFAYQNPALAGPDGIRPDIVTLAKGLGGGFPIGAMVAMDGRTASLLGPGDHGTTFGGNPLGAAAALATLDTVQSEDLGAHAARLGAQWRRELADLYGVTEVRGAGLLLGVGVGGARELTRDALEAGFIANAPNESTIRLAPPLIVTERQAGEFTAALRHLLAAQAASSPEER
jgi:acetylornithine aminotransferase